MLVKFMLEIESNVIVLFMCSITNNCHIKGLFGIVFIRVKSDFEKSNTNYNV